MTKRPSSTIAPNETERTRRGDTLPGEHRWLLLAHHLPPRPSYLRVKVRRQLHRIGAIPLKNSVYLLPPGEDTREDLEWLRTDIEKNGGEATVCLASFLDPGTDARIVTAFREARAADYRSIVSMARAAAERNGTEPRRRRRSPLSAAARKLRRRLELVKAIDFFDAPGREQAEHAVSRVDSPSRLDSSASPEGAGSREPRPRGRVWVTREGIKVDRMASAWLIRRFIDPEATFKFVPARGYAPKEGEIRFDMFDGEYTHEGDRCTFETLVARFALTDPALAAVAEIVHDIDCKEEKYGRPQAAGISSLIEGITRVVESDDERLRQGNALFEGLYEHFRSA